MLPPSIGYSSVQRQTPPRPVSHCELLTTMQSSSVVQGSPNRNARKKKNMYKFMDSTNHQLKKCNTKWLMMTLQSAIFVACWETSSKANWIVFVYQQSPYDVPSSVRLTLHCTAKSHQLKVQLCGYSKGLKGLFTYFNPSAAFSSRKCIDRPCVFCHC